jgi:hypothetical protein
MLDIETERVSLRQTRPRLPPSYTARLPGKVPSSTDRKRKVAFLVPVENLLLLLHPDGLRKLQNKNNNTKRETHHERGLVTNIIEQTNKKVDSI